MHRSVTGRRKSAAFTAACTAPATASALPTVGCKAAFKATAQRSVRASGTATAPIAMPPYSAAAGNPRKAASASVDDAHVHT